MHITTYTAGTGLLAIVLCACPAAPGDSDGGSSTAEPPATSTGGPPPTSTTGTP